MIVVKILFVNHSAHEKKAFSFMIFSMKIVFVISM